MKGWLIHESLIEETMLSEEESLIRCVDNEGVIELVGLVKVIQDSSNALINSSYRLHIVSHESLVDFNVKGFSSKIHLIELF